MRACTARETRTRSGKTSTRRDWSRWYSGEGERTSCAYWHEGWGVRLVVEARHQGKLVPGTCWGERAALRRSERSRDLCKRIRNLSLEGETVEPRKPKQHGRLARATCLATDGHSVRDQNVQTNRWRHGMCQAPDGIFCLILEVWSFL